MQTTGRENLERRSDRPSRDIEQKTKHTQLNAACLSETAKRKLSPCVRIKHACVREKKGIITWTQTLQNLSINAHQTTNFFAYVVLTAVRFISVLFWWCSSVTINSCL